MARCLGAGLLQAGDASDVTSAVPLAVNRGACFIGGMKKGRFDIDGAVAREWLALPNPHRRSNAGVLGRG